MRVVIGGLIVLVVCVAIITLTGTTRTKARSKPLTFAEIQKQVGAFAKLGYCSYIKDNTVVTDAKSACSIGNP